MDSNQRDFNPGYEIEPAVATCKACVTCAACAPLLQVGALLALGTYTFEDL